MHSCCALSCVLLVLAVLTEAAVCPAGTFRNGAACEACAHGKHSGIINAVSCWPCPQESETPAGATACCPSDSPTWRITDPDSLQMPPGKYSTSVYVLSHCGADALESRVEVKADDSSSGPQLFNGSVHVATIHLGKYVHSCQTFECDAASCGVMPPKKVLLTPDDFVSIEAHVTLFDGSDHTCANLARADLSGFGCKDGTITAFFFAIAGIIIGTLVFGVIFEYVFQRRYDVFVEASLLIFSRRSTEEVSASNDTKPLAEPLQQLPALSDLHRDVKAAIQLENRDLPLANLRGWSNHRHEDQQPTAVNVEFRIPTQAANEYRLRQKLLSFAWKPGPAWNLDTITVEQHSPMRSTEKGKLPGADFMDAIEDAVLFCLSGCKRDNIDASATQLHLHAAHHLLSRLLTKQMALAISIQYLTHLAAIVVLPAYAATIMECSEGYPRGVHLFWGGFVFTSCLISNWIVLRPLLPFFRGSLALKQYVSRFRVRLALRFLGMLVSVTDLYQDTSFPVIAGRCGFDLWWVSIWLCVIGIGVMQVLVQGILLFQSYRRYRIARTAEERDRFLVEALFLALRGCDNHVLVYAVRPAVEERLGGHSSWAMKSVEARVAFLRFVFEDAEQSALQVIFLYWFESASLFDKMWVGISTATSLSLSFTITVQTLPEVRDWIWHRFLAYFPGATARFSIRYLWLFLLVTIYRLVTILPWLGLCVPADERDGGSGTLKRLLLLSGYPKSGIVAEAFLTVFLSVIVCIVVTAILSVIWAETLGVSQRWSEWRGSSTQRNGPTYDSSARFAQESQIHAKTEQDEDTWLESLRKLDALGLGGENSQVLTEIDVNVFQLVHVIGMHGLSFEAQKKHVQTLLSGLQLGVSTSPATASDDIKRLRMQIDSNLNCAMVRRAALELLASKGFRQAGLIQKAQLIDQATKGQFPLRLLHWSVIEKLGELPRYRDDGAEDGAEDINAALNRRRHSLSQASAEGGMIVVYLSHAWSRHKHPDTEIGSKAKCLVQFAKWLVACSAMKRIDCDIWFWIDYCCIDTAGPNFESGLAALPLFVAACSDILIWRTAGCDQRCWTMVERLLAYSFCPGGLTPYAVDDNSFAGCKFSVDSQFDQPTHDFSKPYNELATMRSTTESKVVPVDHVDAKMPDVNRYERKLAYPLDTMASRPSDTPIASTQRRHLQRLVDMALAIPALEVFHDRQPVEFGLTSVVELFLGQQMMLRPRANSSSLTNVRIDAPEIGTWLQAAPLEKGFVSDWKLVVEVPNQNAKLGHDNGFSFRPGDDEGVIVLVDSGDDSLGPTYTPDEIENLFIEVDSAYEGHLQGLTDGSLLERAATNLAIALKTDLRLAIDSDDEDQLRKALMRSRDIQLPVKEKATARFCVVQLKNAIATQDMLSLQMALRHTMQESLVDLPEYREAVATLTRLQIKQLRDNALSVVRQDNPDVASIVSVVGVAKQRGWDDIAAEALEVLKANKFVDTAIVKMLYHGKTFNQVAGTANLIKVHRLASEYCIHGVLSLTQDELTKRIEEMSKVDDAQSLADLYIAADSEGCADICRNVFFEFQNVLDRWTESCKEVDKELQVQLENLAMMVSTFGSPALSDAAGLALSDVRKFEERQRSEAAAKINSQQVEAIVEGIITARKWDWEPVLELAIATLDCMVAMSDKVVKNLSSVDALAVTSCVVKLSVIYDVSIEHQFPSVVTHAKEVLDKLLLEEKIAKDPLLLMEMSHAALTNGCSVFAGDTRLALNAVIIALREAEDVAAQGVLAQLQNKAEEYGYPGLVELAGEAIGFVAQRETEHRVEAQAILAENPDITSAIEVWSKANRRGWTSIAEEAETLVRKYLDDLFKTTTQEAVQVLARAACSAKEHHMHRLHKRIQENLDARVRALIVEKNIEEILKMIQVGAAEQAGRAALQAIVEKWKKGIAAEFPYAEVQELMIGGYAYFDEAFAREVDAISKIHIKLKSLSVDDLIEVLQDSRRAGCSGFFKEASAKLASQVHKWKAEGDIAQLQAFVDVAGLVQDTDGASEVLPAMVKTCSSILSLSSILDSLVSDGAKGQVDAVKLVHLVSDLDAMGSVTLAARAREEAKMNVRKYDVGVDADRKALQKLHDAARSKHLDDIADLVVNAVGGSLPNDWRAKREGKLSLLEKTPTKDKELIGRIQLMIDKTYRGWGKMGKDCSTRDRHKLGNPQGSSLRVQSVVHVENAGNYLNYIKRRAEIEEQVRMEGKGRFLNIRTWDVSMQGLWRHPEDPVDSSLNECWLWHGTSEAGVNGITDTDFDMAKAGSTAGSMFGRGLYFTESCLKSDEYATADDRGFAPVLLCRVMLGRVQYCDHKSPWTITDTLEAACKGGGFDSVLGDREKVRGTFREFVVFDSSQVYPEYIVWYSREPPFK